MKRLFRILKIGTLVLLSVVVVALAAGVIWVKGQLRTRDIRLEASKWPADMSPEAADAAAAESIANANPTSAPRHARPPRSSACHLGALMAGRSRRAAEPRPRRHRARPA